MSKVSAVPPARTLAPHRSTRSRGMRWGSLRCCSASSRAPRRSRRCCSTCPVAVSGGGYAVPAAFLIATVALTIFSVGYIEMARRVTVGRRLLHVHHARPRARSSGSAPGILIALCYVIFAAAVIGVLRLLRLDHRSTTWFGIDDPGLGLHGRRLALMTGVRLVPHRADREDPRRRARSAEVLALLVLCVGDHRPRRRPGRLQRRAAEPGRTSSTTTPRSRCSARPRPASRCSARSGRGSASRWRPTTPRSRATRTRSPRRATYGSVIGLGVFYIVRLVHVRDRLGPDRLRAGGHRPVRRQVRLGVLPADRQVRGLRADHDPARS